MLHAPTRLYPPVCLCMYICIYVYNCKETVDEFRYVYLLGVRQCKWKEKKRVEYARCVHLLFHFSLVY